MTRMVVPLFFSPPKLIFPCSKVSSCNPLSQGQEWPLGLAGWSKRSKGFGPKHSFHWSWNSEAPLHKHCTILLWYTRVQFNVQAVWLQGLTYVDSPTNWVVGYSPIEQLILPGGVMFVWLRTDLVGGLEHFLFLHLLGISSSQLIFTPSFFRGVDGVGGSTTNQISWWLMMIFMISVD